MHTNCKIPGHTSTIAIMHSVSWCSYYSLFLLFLGVHVKGSQKYLISQCDMEGQEEPLSDADTSTDLELVALDNLQCSQPSASTSTAPLQTYSSKQMS